VRPDPVCLSEHSLRDTGPTPRQGMLEGAPGERPSKSVPDGVPRIGRDDGPWIALVLVAFVASLLVSWQRWGTPLVDCGREMNQPLRLLRGEALYSQIRHIYGPLSPYLNAALYRLFSPSLAVLYADGIVSAAVVLTLIYWLSRQLMDRAAAAAATLSVMWLCAFMQNGNYVLPYSFSALHGCVLGLGALALSLRWVQTGRMTFLLMASLLTALASLAKIEMGAAAMVAGIAAAALPGRPRPLRVFGQVALFVLPAAGIAIAVYAAFAARVGWDTLLRDSFLFPPYLPPDLVYFNKSISGLDHPLKSLRRMIEGGLRVAAFAGVIALAVVLLTRRTASSARAGAPRSARPYQELAVLLLAAVIATTVKEGHLDKGPYRAVPIVLAALLVAAAFRYRRQLRDRGEADAGTVVVFVTALYGLASLARVVLNVRTGGVYPSFTLPLAVVLFTYAWTHSFVNSFRDTRRRHLAHLVVLGVLFAWAASLAGELASLSRTFKTYRLSTPRGTMIVEPWIGEAFGEAIRFIERTTGPDDAVAVLPEGTSLNFFTNRPNPLREEIVTPGFLDAEGEERAIRQLSLSKTKLVLVTNRATPEFGPRAFGRDYCQGLMRWIEENFELTAVLGPDHDTDLEIGDAPFFIRAYARKAAPGGALGR
jgi:hypothetical protein